MIIYIRRLISYRSLSHVSTRTKKINIVFVFLLCKTRMWFRVFSENHDVSTAAIDFTNFLVFIRLYYFLTVQENSIIRHYRLQ